MFAYAWGPREPVAVREYVFHPVREWRFDFAWPTHGVALEIEGLGRHQRLDGYREDCHKYSEAAVLGWRVLRVMACDRHAVLDWVLLVERALKTETAWNL